MTTDNPHPIDVHVGERVRITRLAAHKSQTDLASAVGVSFQQVQKYEKGTNRISASRLFQFAEILDVDIAHFFRGVEPESGRGPAPYVTGKLGRADIDLVGRIADVDDTKIKRAIIDVIDCLPQRGPGRRRNPSSG